MKRKAGNASRMGWRGVALLLLGSTACSPAPEHFESRGAAVLNGEDDRAELFELEDGAQRELLEGSVAALMWAHRIDIERPGELRATSAREAFGLCDGERFGEQPAAAFCSATLIDDDLVLTAGHCLGSDAAEVAERCQRLWIVFGYGYAEPGRLALGSDYDVFSCRRVVHHEHTSTEQGFRDLAILQLDRPVPAERRRATIATELPRPGAALLAASHGMGLPLKVDKGGTVTELPEGADHLVASTDSFVGGSGAPLFDANLALVGYQVRGARDWLEDGTCVRPAHAAETAEQHQLMLVAIDALCASDWPSSALCGKAPRCGDQVCNGGETSDDCSEDCKAPLCGDKVCELAERASCDQDCRQYLGVPAEWATDPGSYDEPAVVPDDDSKRHVAGGCAVTAAGAHGRGSGADASGRGRGAAGLGELLAVLLLGRRHRRRVIDRHTTECRWRTASVSRL